MIPSAHEVVAGYAFLARRYGLTRVARDDLAAEAINEAMLLATKPEDEPAALFYSLGRRPVTFPGLWSVATAVYSFNHAVNVGLRFRCSVEETRPLFVPLLRAFCPMKRCFNGSRTEANL